ncbi:MAG: SDR family NAD(P)-dependent oxidoreductase, partial [Pseudomonadota bacterium]
RGARPSTYALHWQPMDPAPVRPIPSSFALIGDQAFADALAGHIAARGIPCHRGDDAAERDVDCVVVFAERPAATDEAGDTVQNAAHILTTIKTVAGRGNPPRRLVIATSGAHPADDDAVTDPAAAALVGLVRVARREIQALDIVLVDLKPADAITPDRFLGALASAAPNEEIALCAAGAFVCRLTDALRPAQDNPVKLPAPQTGLPGPGEVAIDVIASGLNFRDVLHHLGRLPQSAARMPYGLECSGKIAAVGPGVDALAPGDPVIAGLSVNSLSGRVVIGQEFVAKKPAALSYREAASLPLAFITAHYALDRLVRLKRGQWVLIHAAAGGVGQAAIQVARRAGAHIIATASPGKWPFLKAQGITHVFNSREGDFSAPVRAATGGRGVDVVLNSLAGEAVTASLSALADGGHFIEIGKLEPWPAERIASLPRGIRFNAFDLWDVKEDTALVAQMMAEMVTRIDERSLSPLPIEPFPVGAATRAFQHMARARHIGKIVIDQHTAALLRPGTTTLITGGLGALGLFMAQWLVERGATHLVLVGRSPPSEEAQRTIALLSDRATVTTAQADVANEAEMAAVIAAIDAGGHPLTGIVHAAGTLADGLIANQNDATLATAMAPKLTGATILDRLTTDRPLDFFL